MKIKHQLRALYLLEAVSGFGLAQVIWVVLLAGRGFSLAQIGLAEGFFHLVSFFCEVPSGMAADLFGRKRTLAAGMAVRALACLAMIASRDIGGVCLAMGLSALSYNLLSGTREAITYDSLLQANRAGDYERVAGRMGVLFRASAMGCSVCAGAALALGWRLAYLTDFAAALTGLVLALGLTEPPRGQKAPATLRDFWPRLRRHVADTGAFLRQNPAAVEKMLLDGACGCCAYFGGQLLQPRLMELGLPAGLLGPVLALLPLAGAAGSALASRVGGRFSRVAVVCAAGIGCSLALAGAPVLALALTAGAAATFWDGLLEVKMTARLNRDFPSDRRATLVSVQSMAYSLAMLPVSPLAGALCDRFGYSGSMAALGLGLLSLVAAGLVLTGIRNRTQ